MSPPSFDKLNHENYFEWSIAMSAYLTRKSLWDITSGVVTRPMGSDNSKPVKAWRAKAAQARAELILFVDPSQYPHMASDDPAEIWIALRDVHQSRGFATRLSRRRLFWRMTKQGNQVMSAWIADVKRSAARLRDVGADISDEDIILVLTNGLPPSYSSVIVALDSTDPSVLDLDFVINRLLNEETRQITEQAQAPVPAPTPTASGPVPNSVAAAAVISTAKPATPLSRITCYNCGKKGHYAEDCKAPKAQLSASGSASTAIDIVGTEEVLPRYDGPNVAV